MDNVVQAQIDIAISTDPYPDQDVVIQQISTTEFAFWQIHDGTFDLHDEGTVIICDPRLPPTQYLLNELKKKCPNRRFRLCTMNDVETMVTMTADGCGVGILPTAWTELRYKGKLTKIAHNPVYRKPLCIAYRAENKNIMAIKVVVDAIKKIAAVNEKKKPQ